MSESNREEALRCLEIAREYQRNGNAEAALKFCRKSISLFRTQEGITLLEALKKPQDKPSSPASSSTPHPPPEPSRLSSDGPRADSERVAVVRRIRACGSTKYYDIMGLKRNCSEADIKKAYRKLAILTHPDKSDVPGAAEAFKMVAQAWQVLGDPVLKEQYDAAPDIDPTSRLSQASSGGHPQFRGGEVSPEELFNMFFGNGGGFGTGGGFGNGPVFTTSFGPNGFQTNVPRRTHGQGRANNAQVAPLLQFLPMLVLFAVAFLSALPNLLAIFSTPDPGYSFYATPKYSSARVTSTYNCEYWVSPKEFTTHPIWESIPEASRGEPQAGTLSQILRSFESGVERVYISSLRSGCNREVESRDSRMERHRGFFGIGADYEKLKLISEEVMPSCSRLRDMGLLSY